MGYFNFYILKKLLKNKKLKKFFIFLIIFIILLIFKNSVFATTIVNPDVTNDYTLTPYFEFVNKQKEYQDDFALFSYYPYINNTEAWTDTLKPIFDRIHQDDFNVYITYTKNETTIQYRIALYYPNVLTTDNASEISVMYNDTYYTVKESYGQQILRYIVNYDRVNNTMTSYSERINNFHIPTCTVSITGDFFRNMFTIMYKPNDPNYSSALNDVNNTLSNIQGNISQTNQNLNNVNTSIQNVEDAVNDVEGAVNDVNDSVQETNEKLDDIKDTITDDTIESSASDLPSTDVSDPTQNGIDNIFQSIYNAFCTGQAQDIVFPIPFTYKNITLSPYYVRDMLNNNGAGWVYTLIQAFWGYLIGRFIIKDISRKITKIKGGNIENVENENIKEEML